MDPVQTQRNRLNTLVLLLPGQWFGLMVTYWARYYPAFRPFHFEGVFPGWPIFLAGCAVSCIPFLLPRNYFIPRAFECGCLYPLLGMKWFRHFTTDGDIVNARLRRNHPEYRAIRDRASLASHIEGTYESERWHLSFFIAGALTSLHAFYSAQYTFLVLIGVTNLIFNLYPVFHQRYKRSRARRMMRRLPAHQRPEI